MPRAHHHRSSSTTDLSSPLSYRTAPHTQSPTSDAALLPQPSSSSARVLSSQESGRSEEGKRREYRKAKPIPYELRHHCLVYLEEGIYPSALSLLSSLLLSSAYGAYSHSPYHPSNHNGSAYAPPPPFLALAATLLTHPTHTSRATTGASGSAEKKEVAAQALTLLRNTLSILGPRGAKLDTAFNFQRTNANNARRSRGSRRGASGVSTRAASGAGSGYGSRAPSDSREGSTDEDSRGHDEENRGINTPLATKQSLWYRATDFWHVVGWSFNCSVRYPNRWDVWKVWFGYMLDTMEADWDEREGPSLAGLDEAGLAGNHEDADAPQDGDDDAEPTRSQEARAARELEGSLIVRYILDAGSSGSAARRIVRSIFADGSTECVRLYPEVWDRETAATTTGVKRKREEADAKVDLEADRYGDYYDEDSPSGSQTGDAEDLGSSQQVDGDNWPLSSSFGSQPADPSGEGYTSLLDPDAIALRLRLLSLLLRASYALSSPSSFSKGLFETDISLPTPSTLYTLLWDALLSLPLRVYSSLIFSFPPHLGPQLASSIIQHGILRLMPGSAARPKTEDLSLAIFIKFWATATPSTASVGDNVRVAVLVEGLGRLVLCIGIPTPEDPPGAEGDFREGKAEADADHEKEKESENGNGEGGRLGEAIGVGIGKRREKCMRRGRKGKAALAEGDEEGWRMLEEGERRLRALGEVFERRAGVPQA